MESTLMERREQIGLHTKLQGTVILDSCVVTQSPSKKPKEAEQA